MVPMFRVNGGGLVRVLLYMTKKNTPSHIETNETWCVRVFAQLDIYNVLEKTKAKDEAYLHGFTASHKCFLLFAYIFCLGNFGFSHMQQFSCPKFPIR